MTLTRVKVLVTGAGGQVGKDLVDTLRALVVPGADPTWQPDERPVTDDEFTVLALNHHDLDVTNADEVNKAIAMSRPDVIVNLAAYTAVDRAESDVERCHALNCDAVATLSNVSHDTGVHLVTISTDYVFDGQKGSAYVETDATNPLNIYGRTKRDGELQCAPSDTIVRTSWVVGARGRTVVHAVAERVSKGETVKFVNDQVGTFTSSADLARALATLIRERPGGLWHVSNRDAVTWYEIARTTALLVNGRTDLVEAISSEQLEPAPAAARPSRSDLANQRWDDAGWVSTRPWLNALERVLADR